MIYKLKGIVVDIEEDFLVIEVNGVGYQVFCNARLLAKVQLDEAIEVFTYTHVREDQFTLFGFNNLDERKMYLKLLNVNGVGPKMGLAILSVCSVEDIIQSVNNGEPKILQAASGVGKKVAERIIIDLSGSLPTFSAGGGIVSSGAKGALNSAAGGVMNDVTSALSNMGFKIAQSNKAVLTASQNLGNNQDFGLLLKESLKVLKS